MEGTISSLAMDPSLQLLDWLAQRDGPEDAPEGSEARLSGDDLAELVVMDGVLELPPFWRDAPAYVAQVLGDLRHQQLIAWDWVVWPEDSEPPPPSRLTECHLTRILNVRVTRKGADLAARRRKVPHELETSLDERVRPGDASKRIEKPRDVFISHATEDRDAIARPLATALQARGLTVWFDEYELTVGDSLSEQIDDGLATSSFGAVIVSRAFLSKPWPKRELRGLVAREMARGTRIILPVWHGVDYADVAAASPPLADVLAAKSSEGTDTVAERIAQAVRRRQQLGKSQLFATTEPDYRAARKEEMAETDALLARQTEPGGGMTGDSGRFAVDASGISWTGRTDSFRLEWTDISQWGSDEEGIFRPRTRVWIITRSNVLLRFNCGKANEGGRAFADAFQEASPIDPS